MFKFNICKKKECDKENCEVAIRCKTLELVVANQDARLKFTRRAVVDLFEYLREKRLIEEYVNS